MELRTGDCPLGAKCEEVKMVEGRQILYRCPWYVEVAGLNPNTGEELKEFNCAITWMPTLMINAANEARKGAMATEAFKNEVLDAAQHPRQLPSS